MNRRRPVFRADFSPRLLDAGIWLFCVVVALLVLFGSTVAFAAEGTAETVAANAGGWVGGGGALGLGATIIYVTRPIIKAAEALTAAIEASAKHRSAEVEQWEAGAAHRKTEEAHHARIESALDEALSALPGAKRRPTGERLAAVEEALTELLEASRRDTSQPIHVARRPP